MKIGEGNKMELKARQQKAAELLALRSDMKEKEIAAEVGISAKQLWKWKTTIPEFMEYYHELCEKRFRDIESLAVEKLKDNVIKGNQKAIEYALAYLGYKATQKVEAEVNTDINITIGD